MINFHTKSYKSNELKKAHVDGTERMENNSQPVPQRSVEREPPVFASAINQTVFHSSRFGSNSGFLSASRSFQRPFAYGGGVCVMRVVVLSPSNDG